MSVLRAIYDRLAGEAEVVARVGDRIDYGYAAQNITADRLVIRHVSTAPHHVMDGPGGCADTLADVVCLSPTYLGAERLAVACRSALDGKLIRFDGQAYVIEVESDEELAAELPEGKSIPVACGRTVSLRVFHTETIPAR